MQQYITALLVLVCLTASHSASALQVPGPLVDTGWLEQHLGEVRILDVREDIESFGIFVEVHVSTSLEECERRDRKGLYKLAREGKIKEFTGISDPYDVPENPELRVETLNVDVDTCAHQVLLKLESMGLIDAE